MLQIPCCILHVANGMLHEGFKQASKVTFSLLELLVAAKNMEYMLNPIAHRLGTVCYGGRGAESGPQFKPHLGVANRVK